MGSLLMNGQNHERTVPAVIVWWLCLPTGTALSSANVPKYWFLREIKGIFSGKHLIIQHKTENWTLKTAPLFTQNYEFCAGSKWFGFRQMCRTRQEIRKQTLWEQEIIQIDPFTYGASVLGFIGWFEGFFLAEMCLSPNQPTLSPPPSARSQVSKPKVLSQIWGVSEWTSQNSVSST